MGENDQVPYRKGVGRPPLLDTPEKIEAFAALLCEGFTTQQLADHFQCNERTVREYKKHPGVKAAAARFTEDRVVRITSKTDTIIAKRLEHADELDTETLLKIRKEFLGGTLRAKTTGDVKDDGTINAAMEAIEQNPEFAKQIAALVGNGQ